MVLVQIPKRKRVCIYTLAEQGGKKQQEGKVYVFPTTVAFVDGSKIRTVQPSHPDNQTDRYCVHHQFHCFSTLSWTDVFGVIIRVDMALSGSDNDRIVYNRCAVVKRP